MMTNGHTETHLPHVPNWALRFIIAITLALASAALGWSFSISKDVATIQQGQLDTRSQLQEINQRLEDIQLRLMQKSYQKDEAYHIPPSDWFTQLGKPAAAHPIKQTEESRDR